MKDITGLMVYYYFICERKLWYFINEINMEQKSELVSIGKILDETTYTREKHSILIDNTINIDFIKNGAILHEVKKTKSIEKAGIWQVKYYMYYLKEKGVKNITAKIDFPLLRETEEIALEEKDMKVIENIIKNIEDISKSDQVPETIKSKTCKKCAYFDLCYV